MLRGPGKPRVDCLYTPQHWGELRVLLGFISLSALLICNTRSGGAGACPMALFKVLVYQRSAPSFGRAAAYRLYYSPF